MGKQKFYFAKLKYNDDFYTFSSFSLTYSHTYSNINYIKILFCSCLGLLPNSGSNNVTKSNCFNCCVLKMLGNSAYSNASEP
jgi:hypothetical protein